MELDFFAFTGNRFGARSLAKGLSGLGGVAARVRQGCPLAHRLWRWRVLLGVLLPRHCLPQLTRRFNADAAATLDWLLAYDW